jgi:hypothetical protein
MKLSYLNSKSTKKPMNLRQLTQIDRVVIPHRGQGSAVGRESRAANGPGVP